MVTSLRKGRALKTVAAERAAQLRQQVGRHHPGLRVDELRGDPVGDGGRGRRVLRLHPLGEERGDDAGKHVA